ncbi:MAG: rhomboid family intramembrane serine protease [Aquabacterium sp.]
MPPIPPVTKALMLVCVVAFCLDELMRAFGATIVTSAGLVTVMDRWFGLWPLASGGFWPWQVVTYALLHGDMVHLFFNMLGLWMFGAELERLWGQRRFQQMLLASVLAAAAVQIGFTALVGARSYTVGASGALFGLLLSFGMLFPNRVIMPLFPPIPMKARTFVMVFGCMELFFGLTSRGGIAHFAHLGGMLGAFLLIRYWRGQPPFGGARRR